LIVRLAVTAIALSLAIMLISIAVVKGFQGEITQKVIGFGSHIQISKTELNKSFENEAINLDAASIDSIKDITGVAHVQKFAHKPGIMKTGEAIEGVVLKGIGQDFNWEFFKQRIEQGSKFDLNDTSAVDQLIISRDLADRLRLQVDDEVLVYFVQEPSRVRKFNIKGIYNTGLQEVDKIFALCDLKHVQKLNGWNSAKVGGYEVLVQDAGLMEQISRDINYYIDAYLNTQTIKQIFPQIFDWLGLLNINVQIILSLMAIVAAINMITALLIMILERTQMIGTIKALGASNQSVKKIFLINAMFLIGLGVLIGDLLGLGLMWLQYQYNFIELKQASYYVKEVPIYFEWFEFILINIATFVFCALMMIIPSIIVSRILPVKALRFD